MWFRYSGDDARYICGKSSGRRTPDWERNKEHRADDVNQCERQQRIREKIDQRHHVVLPLTNPSQRTPKQYASRIKAATATPVANIRSLPRVNACDCTI